MEWVAREQLRAEQRKLKLGMHMVEGRKGEMGRIYLNPSGPPNKGRGPRAKRMFVPLAATQRAAQVRHMSLRMLYMYIYICMSV